MKTNEFDLTINKPVSQLERCPSGANIFADGASLSELVLISENQNKKRSSHKIGLLNFKFSADLQKIKKKVIAPNWSTFLRVLCWSQKNKSHRLETAARKRAVWRGVLAGLGGGKIFVWGVPPPFAPPLVAALQ